MSYKNTLVRVSADCPVNKSEIPVAKAGKKTKHLIEYELLTERPYTLDHEGLIYEVYIRQKGLADSISEGEAQELKAELFSKGHPCMRASALVKRYGFGAHYDNEGRIGIYPCESAEYKAFLENEDIAKVPGMRTRKSP